MKRFLFLSCLLVGLSVSTVSLHAADFRSRFAKTHDRVWIGEQYWANPMEDWQVKDGRLECITPGGQRNVQLLTRQLGKKKGDFFTSVTLGRIGKGKTKGSAGFRIGIHDPEIDDYRGWLIRGPKGLDAGITANGTLFLGSKTAPKVVAPAKMANGVTLSLRALLNKDKKTYRITLAARLPKSKDPVAKVELDSVPANVLYGNIALATNHKLPPRRRNGGAQFWFKEWKVSGEKVEEHNDRAYGPILWSMYTLSRGTMKMNVMMPPIGKKDSQKVRLQIKKGDDWKTIAEEKIEELSRTALFKVQKWNDKKDIPYRIAYTSIDKDGTKKEVYYTGTVRKDPVKKKSIVVAAFTGNADYAFPNVQLAKNVKFHNPDVLFFSGDNIYENVGGYGIIRTPYLRSILNYLRKWYLAGLAFGDLMKDRPSIAIPDDHDVYQGNIWGNGGNKITMAKHEAGGYAQPWQMVNVVHRTQTGNLPDAYDPTPIKQGITVYYTDMLYGRISFAVIADRMFKSGPRGTVATWGGRPDHLKDPKYDVSKLDKPGLKLLGERQLKFLKKWAADWRGVDMQCVCSQTIFCNLANYHGANRTYLVADLDSGGWPQSGRNRALDAIRRGFALHLAGDQHLASIVHHGIKEQGDACYSFCVPSIANFYPRRWQPDKEGLPVKNRIEGRANTGDYKDGFKNLIRVYAIAIPEEKYRKGRLKSLHDKASGYGIVRFNREKQTITMECYKLLVDVSKPKKMNQFPGWPMTISMLDNYGRKAVAYLPKVVVKGMKNPVVQVINEKTKEIEYTLRIRGTSFRPKVFQKDATYTIKAGEQGTKKMRTMKGIRPAKDKELKVTFD